MITVVMMMMMMQKCQRFYTTNNPKNKMMEKTFILIKHKANVSTSYLLAQK